MLNVGVDLGGTNIAVGVVDENYNIVARANRKTNVERKSEEIVDDIAAAALEATQKAGAKVSDISYAGIGVPGSVDSKGGIVRFTPNMPFSNLPLKAMLLEKTGLSFDLENDANAAALGEGLAGSGKGCSDFVMITLGTGVGGGIIANGKLVTGVNSAGGELGHIVICMGGEKCGCGRRGCFESYGSVSALIAQTKAKMEKCPDSLMHAIAEKNGGAVNGRTSFDAMKMGDKAACEVVDKYTDYLACGLGSIINIFQPEILAIGGGISKEGEVLLSPIREKLKSESFNKNLEVTTQIRAATLFGDAGIIGAAFISTLK